MNGVVSLIRECKHKHTQAYENVVEASPEPCASALRSLALALALSIDSLNSGLSHDSDTKDFDSSCLDGDAREEGKDVDEGRDEGIPGFGNCPSLGDDGEDTDAFIAIAPDLRPKLAVVANGARILDVDPDREDLPRLLARRPNSSSTSSSSSTHSPLPSSISSSFASLITTTSLPRAFLPSSISEESFDPIQSI